MGLGEGGADLLDRTGAVHEDDQACYRAVLVVLDLGGYALLHEADHDAIAGQGHGLMNAFDAGDAHENLPGHQTGGSRSGLP
jgi:hypothetical protein